MQPTLDAFTMGLIRRAARKLVGKFGFTPSDRPDLEQDLALEVFRRFQEANQDVDRPEAFATTVVKNSVINMLDSHKAKRKRQVQCESLDEMIQGPDGRQVAVGETISENHRLRPLPCGADGEAEFQERMVALDRLISGLPRQLRIAAEALKKGTSLDQVARDVGIPQSTLRARLRRIFSAAGFSKNFADYPAD